MLIDAFKKGSLVAVRNGKHWGQPYTCLAVVLYVHNKAYIARARYEVQVLCPCGKHGRGIWKVREEALGSVYV